MKIKSGLIFLMLCGFNFKLSVYAQSDVRIVQSEFDRCLSVMERIERSLKRYETSLHSLKRTVTKIKTADKDNISDKVSAHENRFEYFRNRYERIRGQADKLHDDLKSSGPVCPSCIESSVNLFCRSNETLQNDLDDYLVKLSELQSITGLGNDSKSKENSFKHRLGYIKELCKKLNKKIESCNDNAVNTLWEQARINLKRADSLYSSNETGSAVRALEISESLLQKIQLRCE